MSDITGRTADISNVIPILKNAKPKPREPKILTFLHCALCLEELPADTSPMEYAEMSVGFTVEGIQLWCNRHNANVVHLDFNGVLMKAIAG